MEDFKNDRVKRFINDKAMSDAVYSVILDSFLKDRPDKDVYVLAASRLAINYLNQAWKDLEKYWNSVDKEPIDSGNIGL